MNKTPDFAPISEGMRYGPVAPPELHPEASAEWVMKDVAGDPQTYQLTMLRDQLISDEQKGAITKEIAEPNLQRLNHEIALTTGLRHIRKIRKNPPTPRIVEWVQAADIEHQALLELAHLTKDSEAAATTFEAAKGASRVRDYRQVVQKLHKP